MSEIKLSLQSSVVGRSNLKTYINAAKAAGFYSIEPNKDQLSYYFNAGYSVSDLKMLLGDLNIASVGWLPNIERQGHDFVVLMNEAESLFAKASAIGSQSVELINGPVDWRAVDCFQRNLPYDGYMGLQALSLDEQRPLLVKNLKALADLAKQFNLMLFFEPLCWTPINSLKMAIPLVEQAGRDNLKIVVDFYHNYIAGLHADDLSRIDKDMILGVHVCNSKKADSRVPAEEIFRDVSFYEGEIPLQEWISAVKSTGFKGWWAYETFSKKEAEEDVYEFAKYIHDELYSLVFDEGKNI